MPDVTPFLQVLAAVASAIAAVLAWLAKLKWAKEFADAKDETIRSKDEQLATLKLQIEHYRELTPMKLREYFTSVKDQLQEFNDNLQTQLRVAHAEIQAKSDQIVVLERQGVEKSTEVALLRRERTELERVTEVLENVKEFALRPETIELAKLVASSAVVSGLMLGGQSDTAPPVDSPSSRPVELNTTDRKRKR